MTTKPGSPPTEKIQPDPPDLPSRTVMRQRWTDLAYFHWPYEPSVVQHLLPDGVRVDTFDDRAWVGLVPFVMRDVRIGPTPAIPRFGTFVEINVRTYVVDPLGRRAVWFFSLDVPTTPVVAVARSLFALPYCWSRTEYDADGDGRHYSMSRRWPRACRASADLEFSIGAPIDEPSELEHFLSARWALLTRRRGRLLYGRVHHERWPLCRVDRWRVEGDVVAAAGLPTPAGEPHTMCSPGVGVAVSWLERAGAAA